MLHLLNALLLAGIWVGARWGWIRLSAEAVGPWECFLLPLVTTVLAVGMYGLARALPRWPHLLNVPRKDEVLALSPAGRAPILREASRLLHASTTFLLVLFAVVQYAVYRELLGHDTTGLTVAILVLGVLGGPVLTAVFLIRVLREVRRALDGGP